MSDLHVHLDASQQASDPEGKAPPVPLVMCGQTLTGVVTSSADLSRAKAWYVEVGWRTDGSGDRDGGMVGTFEGAPAQKFSFRFTVPNQGPVTFHGKHVHIRWFVRAKVNVPWAIDPTVEQEFVVMPRRESTSHPVPQVLGPTVAQSASGCSSVLMWFFVGVWNMFVFSFGLAMFLAMKEDRFHGSMLVGFLGWSVFAAFGLLLLAGLIWKPLARMKIAVEAIDLANAALRLGDRVEGTVHLRARRPMSLNRVLVSLQCEERAKKRQGTTTYHYNASVHQAQIEGLPGATLGVGEPKVLRFAFQIPAMSMHSFSGNNNWVTWKLKVLCDVPRWPDLIEEYPLVVSPAFAPDQS